MELKNILEDNEKWEEMSTSSIGHKNFLNFYRIRAYITPIGYHYRVVVSLSHKGCQCFYKVISIRNTVPIPDYVEEYIKNNFKNLYELPKFIKLLDELELDYDVLSSQVCIKFLILTKRKNKGIIRWKLVHPDIDDIKKLIKRCQYYLLYNWEMLKDYGSIEKYCKNERNNTTVEYKETDPIFPG